MTVVDRLGRDAAAFTEQPHGDGRMVRVPLLDDRHRWQMVHDLYHLGWSFRLIQQALRLDEDVVLAWLNRREPP